MKKIAVYCVLTLVACSTPAEEEVVAVIESQDMSSGAPIDMPGEDQGMLVDSGDSGPASGELGGACYGNGTCNDGLMCQEDVCVEVVAPQLSFACVAMIDNNFAVGTWNFRARVKNDGGEGQFQVRLSRQPCAPGVGYSFFAEAGVFTAAAGEGKLYEAEYQATERCLGFVKAELQLQTAEGWMTVEESDNIEENTCL